MTARVAWRASDRLHRFPRVWCDELWCHVGVDTTIIGGGGDMRFTPGLRRYLQTAARTSRRLAATCTGAFYLADAGVLDGRRVTTHWFFADAFKRGYPEAKLVEDQLFVVDGSIGPRPE